MDKSYVLHKHVDQCHTCTAAAAASRSEVVMSTRPFPSIVCLRNVSGVASCRVGSSLTQTHTGTGSVPTTCSCPSTAPSGPAWPITRGTAPCAWETTRVRSQAPWGFYVKYDCFLQMTPNRGKGPVLLSKAAG